MISEVYFAIFATIKYKRYNLKDNMQDKLQELTDRLYNEGLSKGKQDGEELLQRAKADAGSIIADATEKANQILAQANKEAEELKTKVAADVKMAATQSIAVTKQEIEKMVVTKAAATGVKATMDNPAFVKNEIANQFKGEVKVDYSKKINGGFKVAPKDGGYVLQFTDDEFTQLIANYLRPATKKILFG